MSILSITTLTQSIVELLTEAYSGPPNPAETWFIDNAPDSGILGILAAISAEEASTVVDGSGAPGSTIAANVEHLRWSLANTIGAMRGQAYNPNWTESWNTLDADQAKWNRLRDELRKDYETLREVITEQEELSGEYLNGVLALIPHAAFHLGIIRQMIERVRSVQ